MSGSNSNFDEKSGVVSHPTEFGRWWQTVNEVVVEVDVEKGTRGKEVVVVIKPSHLECRVKGNIIFKGKPFEVIVEDESTWTLEDQKLVRIQLVKSTRNVKDQCWLSLLEGQFTPDPLVLHEMRKKLDLERFQMENPGFDFSSAKLDKRYDGKYIKEMADATNQKL